MATPLPIKAPRIFYYKLSFWQDTSAGGTFGFATPPAICDISPRLPSARLCDADLPSTLKGGDYVKSTISTPKAFVVTATGITPALAKCP
jgi:hypothetical protein